MVGSTTKEGPLAAFINGQELGREESHTLFDGVYALAYRINRDRNIQLLRSNDGSYVADWGGSIEDLSAGGNSTQTDYMLKTFGIGALLKVVRTENEGLDVQLNGIKVEGNPIAVSFAREKQVRNRDEHVVVVLVYPNDTVFSEGFGSEEFRKMFPTYVDKFIERGKDKTYPGKKAVRDSEKLRITVLMMTIDTDLKEMIEDRDDIRQLFVVAMPETANRLNTALTEGIILD